MQASNATRLPVKTRGRLPPSTSHRHSSACSSRKIRPLLGSSYGARFAGMKNHKHTFARRPSPNISSLVNQTISQLRDLSQRVDKALQERNSSRLLPRSQPGTTTTPQVWAIKILSGRPRRPKRNEQRAVGPAPSRAWSLDSFGELLQRLQKRVRQLTPPLKRKPKESR